MVALKGVANGGEGKLADSQRAALNPQWGYGWSSECPGEGFGEFVPMVWGGGKVAASLKTIQKELPKTRATHLLGFNEPDLKTSSYKQQSNMTVSEAIKLWPQLEKSGLRLGAPATIKPNATWLDQFMAKAESKGLRIDFMPVHIYGWPNSEDFLDKLSDLHKKYQLPIWVTEYAVADFKASTRAENRYTRTEVNQFMQETVDGMRALPYVERFAWKTRASTDPKMGTSALFHTNGTLTTTGELYASL
jgi:hypothetical protein